MIKFHIAYSFLIISSYLGLNAATAQQIDDALAHKIILCTGPSFGRKELLLQTTQKDLAHIPFKKIFIATNDERNCDIFFEKVATSCHFFNARGKQLDCLNCIIVSIQKVIQDRACLDDDIIIFKHESVYISDMNLIRQAVGKILDGYQLVCKYWLGFPTKASQPLNDYYHTDSFIMSVGAARAFWANLQEVSQFCKDYQFCEEFFTKHMVNNLSSVYKIDYHHSSWKDNELGFYHIPRYEEDAHWYWDKKNYHEIYNR